MQFIYFSGGGGSGNACIPSQGCHKNPPPLGCSLWKIMESPWQEGIMSFGVDKHFYTSYFFSLLYFFNTLFNFLGSLFWQVCAIFLNSAQWKDRELYIIFHHNARCWNKHPQVQIYPKRRYAKKVSKICKFKRIQFLMRKHGIRN